jgi:predicted  nucleic acid-binding Zn-ribbon protein
MSPDLERLIQLQHIDTAIATARGAMASLPQRLAEADARLSDAQAVVDAVKQRIKEGQEQRRALEKDAAMYQGRLSKFKEQLAAVKTNREYQAMQHEIETAQTDVGAVEEKVLERMMEADALAGELRAADAALAEKKKVIDAEKAELAAEHAKAERELQTAQASRAGVVSALSPRLLAMFEQVAKVRKGVAVSCATRDGLCAVCHVRLRPQVFQQIRQNDAIIQCDSCQRIMYYVPPPPPVEPPVVHQP